MEWVTASSRLNKLINVIDHRPAAFDWQKSRFLIDFLLFLDWNIKTTSFMLSRNRTSSNPLGRRGRRVGWLDKCACYLCFPINIVNKFLIWWMNSSSTILDCCWERWWLLLAETSLHLLEVLVRFGRTETNIVHCSQRRWSWSLSCSWTRDLKQLNGTEESTERWPEHREAWWEGLVLAGLQL